MKYISRIFRPTIVAPKNAVIKIKEAASKSQKLMFDTGIARPCGGTGLHAFLPLGERSLRKLTSLVENEMEEIGAQKITLPTLANEELWSKSGRIEHMAPELMITNDRHEKKLILNPTHEEVISDLLGSISPVSSKCIPLWLYQISNKFRDEMRPRFGVIRSREFLMKDLYTFDLNIATARKSYSKISDAYHRIFTKIGVDFIKVQGDTGMMGGSYSHEYHYKAAIGEDLLLHCKKCDHKMTRELAAKQQTRNKPHCVKCGNSETDDILQTNGIEVAHTFLLGKRYTEPFGVYSTVENDALHMGCFGIGLSRIIGAALESLSSDTELRWPVSIAPYNACIIGPKDGSKEEAATSHFVESLYTQLNNSCQKLKNDVIIDDRSQLTIGKRVLDAKRVGFPFIVVVGQKATHDPPQFELIDVNSNSVSFLNGDALIQKMIENTDHLESQTNNKILNQSHKIADDFVMENVLK